MKTMKTSKKQSLLIICISIFILSSCQSAKNDDFAIYLLADSIPATELDQADINELILEDKPLISGEDIISYDTASHIIELTQTAYARIQNIFPTPVKVDGIPFVVCVGNERIYPGAFWTPLSSLSYNGIVILQPFDTESTFIQIELGYPSPEVFIANDPRADPRILELLKQNGKLK
jgi:hypothetical protein